MPLFKHSVIIHKPLRMATTICTAHQYRRLQSVLNAAARLIYRRRRFDHVTPLLRDLHWLKAPERVAYKLAVTVYRCLHGTAPPYLCDGLQRVAELNRRRLRSSASNALVVPATRLVTVGDRAFPVAGCRLWNSLPTDVTSATTLPVFLFSFKNILIFCFLSCMTCVVCLDSSQCLCSLY